MEAPVMVETVTIPLKVNKVKPTEPNNNDENTGFPFDDSDFDDRDRSFRSHIDDIVQRHPELAEHLNFDRNFERFPFRSNTWGHKRRGSSSSGDESRPSGSTENRRFARPFGSRFEERFGFPFSRTFDGEPEYYQQKSHSQPQAQSSSPQAQAETQEEKKSQPEEKTADKPPQIPNNERGRKQNPHIPQSSTVDLGQKQEPVHDNRGQRSMSAPPENRAGQQRFVSSINIPIQNAGDGTQQPQQPQPQPQQQQWQQQPKPQPPQHSKSNERVIPIHVEGRDEPVIPKHGNQTFNQPPPQSSERTYTQPQPERVYGQRPAGFGHWERSGSPYYTGDQFFPGEPPYFPGEQQYFDGSPQFFMNRGEPHQQRPNPEEYFTGPFRQQQYQKQQQKPQQPQQQHQQHQQTAPPPQQQQQQQQQPQQQQQQQQPPPQQQPPQQQQPQQQQTPPPQPPPPPKGPIDQIKCIQKDVLQLMDQVEKFNGKPKDKQYLYLDEMLTRNLLKLDDVETEGKDNIRQARKEAINCIQRCISILEAKAAANEQLRSELMDVDARIDTAANEAQPTTEAIPLTCLEVSGTPRAGVEVQPDEQPSEQASEKSENTEGVTPMEVTPSVPVEAAETKEQAPVLPQSESETAEVKQPEEQQKEETTTNEAKENEQSKETPKEEVTEGNVNANVSEQPAADATNTSQPTEATKEEVKDKKEKKKVKKKEKTTDKTEKK
ncbi:hypothetical protein ILUMI_10654 [Ignelater luminosus]|uniref:BAG domain-containing protein n=1 Tax=Ignelater luminosus TaxID=2038154 RepID=A0A8K0D6M6_IGNLU|nr:hypothetical protein ILUMI_10654 [Ignelater luminosus]